MLFVAFFTLFLDFKAEQLLLRTLFFCLIDNVSILLRSKERGVK